MHRLRRFNFISLLVLSAFCVVPCVLAQAGGIKGKVKNLNGDGIAGATVTARLNGQDIRSSTSDKKGQFVIENLEAGLYNIVVDATGYGSGVKYGVEVVKGKIRDLGDRLILTTDRGSFVIIDGSVFFKNGTRLAGASVKVERVNPDGSTRKLASLFSNGEGDFAFRQRPGVAKLRITASYNGKAATKDVEVDNAALYHVALTIDAERPQSDPDKP